MINYQSKLTVKAKDKNIPDITFEDLFDLDDIQTLQDDFSITTGVASIITRPDGTAITRPSNFCRLCKDIIRKTAKGLINCQNSDSAIGGTPEQVNIQKCLGCGLWDAGLKISANGHHLANWMTGQVRDESQTEDKIIEYAKEIGCDETKMLEAFREVPVMPLAQLKKIIKLLSNITKQLSSTAYLNIQQSRYIKQQKQTEDALLANERELQQARKMETIGTLAGGIAHDFNNILSPIVGHAEMLMDDAPENSQLAEGLNEIYSGALRARNLVKQILTFARQEKSEMKLMKMQPVIKEALNFIRSTIPSMIDIEHDIDNGCGIIKGDPTQVYQIILNLTANASHAMEQSGGVMTIALEEVILSKNDVIYMDIQPGVYAHLRVSDTGTGMNKDLIKKIFDPFFTTKKKGKGTGMGLAVIYGIIKTMSGNIQVFSKPGEGTVFHVYLPIEEKTFEEKIIPVPIPVQKGDAHILLVDDESAIVDMEKIMLERLGYGITSCSSSLEALEFFRINPDKFDLVITDMSMPNMPGDKLATELIKIRSDIPIILCSGFSEIMSEKDANSLGIKGFLMKPVTMSDLASKIAFILD